MSSIELIGLFTDCLTTARAGFLSKGSRNAIPLPTGRLRRWGAANRQSRCVALVHKRSRRRLLPAQGTVEYFHHTGLKTGAPCPVYAAAEAWSGIRAGPMPKAYRIEPRSAVTIRGLILRRSRSNTRSARPQSDIASAPGESACFYAPDLVRIHDQREALAGHSLVYRRRSLDIAPDRTRARARRSSDMPRFECSWSGAAMKAFTGRSFLTADQKLWPAGNGLQSGSCAPSVRTVTLTPRSPMMGYPLRSDAFP